MDWIITGWQDGEEFWDRFYEACPGWFAVASGDLRLRPDLGSGQMVMTGTLLLRDSPEYENSPDDVLRWLKKNGYPGERVYI